MSPWCNIRCNNLVDGIKLVPLSECGDAKYKKHLADVLIMRQSGALYLQKHAADDRHPNLVHLFGGHVEEGETPAIAAIREINEETGGIIEPKDLIYIGSVSEDFTNHTELVHIYFWHDRTNTITGCYEREWIEFATKEAALAHPHLMPYSKWAIETIQDKPVSENG